MQRRVARFLMLGLVIAVVIACSVGCGSSSTSTSTSASSTSTSVGASSSTSTSSSASSTAATSPSTVVKIGVLLPLSGGAATAGQYQLEGMQMAVDYANSHGGIASMGGAQIELVISDTAADVQTGATEFQRLISVEEVSAVCGPFNSAVAASTAPLAIQNKVPYVLTNAIADNILQSGPNKYVYRANYGASDMAPFRLQVAQWLASKKASGQISKIAIVYVNDDWGKSESSTWSKAAEEIGANVVVNEGINPNSSDLSSVVNKIKDANPDFVVAGIFLNDAVLFTKQMKQYKVTMPILGSGTGFSDNKYLPSVGAANAEDIMNTRDFSPSFGTKNADAAALYATYESTHDNLPMPLETCNGWCGMGTLIEAFKAAGSADREAIADALYNMDLPADSFPLWFSAFTGIKFNTAGDSMSRYNQNQGMGTTAGQIVCQVQNGQPQLVFPEDLATAQVIFGK